MKTTTLRNKGFTLIEIAIVLIIVALILGGVLGSLSAQIEQRQLSDSRKDLSDIKRALIGYAMSHTAVDGKPYLPCPDTDADGAENRVGGLCTNLEGGLPWSDLGMPTVDSWNSAYRYRVTLAFSNQNMGIRLISAASVGDITVRDAAAGNILASNVPVVVYSRGKNGVAGGTDEVENTSSNAVFVSHEIRNLAGNEFDDIVDWIPTPIIFYELVSAGQLP